ncbi:MAG TPA: hypothetical protein VFD10_08040 [Atribacterota bacterium]|nr:hypothetical protein [Atribacterota bacterium]
MSQGAFVLVPAVSAAVLPEVLPDLQPGLLKTAGLGRRALLVEASAGWQAQAL